MARKILFAAILIAALATAGLADQTSQLLLARAWPSDPSARLSNLGRGIGVVFTPDLSVPGNCRFYESLGFACFQNADWNRVLTDIRIYNLFHEDDGIRTLILETHGTNGNGLKLQTSYAPDADRSYISVGALQERLEPYGIESIIISACNSGRLLRPAIYNTIDRNNGDRLFLPATRGIIDASPGFDPSRSRLTVITPASSHIEASLAANVKELAPVTRILIERAARKRGVVPPQQFAISDLMMQIILRDSRLALSTSGYVEQLSGEIDPVDTSEALFRSFKSQLNSMAAKELPSTPSAARSKTARAAGKKAPAKATASKSGSAVSRVAAAPR